MKRILLVAALIIAALLWWGASQIHAITQRIGVLL